MKILPSLGVIFFTLVFNTLFSQNNFTDYVPRSPEAEALFKYEDIPVSLYTGTPSIGYPLLGLKEGELGVDVSINYHASGIRVNETASWVGLGWSLNTGGMVSRKLRGEPDDTYRGFLDSRSNYTYQQVKHALEGEDRDMANQIAEGCEDFQPDEFYFSAGGYSGKFAFDWTPGNGPIVSATSEIKVEVIDDPDPSVKTIKGWKIITPDGLVYTYEAKEISRTEGVDLRPVPISVSCRPAIQEYVSSWHLSKIESPYGNRTITYRYEPYKLKTELIPTHSVTLGYLQNVRECRIDRVSAVQESFSSQEIEGQRIKEIVSDNYRIFFEKGNLRQDVNFINGNQAVSPDSGMYELKRIRLLNRHTNHQISGWEFNYSYRDNSQPNNSSQGKRLMLANMSSIGDHGQTKAPYTFTYDPMPLPDPHAAAVDHWGYYNRKNNDYLVPSYIHLEQALGENEFLYYEGADRSPDLAGSKASVLERITMPTGGFIAFEYELHEYGYIGETEVAQIYPYTVVPDDEECHAISLSETNWEVSSVPFEVVSTSTAFAVDIPVKLVAYGQTFTNLSGLQPKIAIYEDLGNGTYSSPPTRMWDETYTGEMIEFTDNFLLPPGNYVLVCSTRKTGDNITANIYWSNLEEEMPTLSKEAGGLRVKKIIAQTAENDSPPLIRRFKYETENLVGTSISSGVIQGEAEYAYKSHTVSTDPNNPSPTPIMNINNCNHCRSLNLVGASRIALGNRENSHVNYLQIETIFGENAEGGSNQSFFSNALDIINHNRPFGSPVSNAHLAGKLIKQEQFELGSSTPSQTVENTYTDLFVDIPSIKVDYGRYPLAHKNDFCHQSASGYLDFEFDIDKFAIWDKPLRMGVTQLQTVVSTTTENGQPISTTQTSQYDPSLHWLEQTETTNSDQTKEIVTYTYLKDINLPSSSTDPKVQALKILSDKHILSTPLETKQAIQYGTNPLQVVGGTLLTFQAFQPNKAYPFEAYTLETADLLPQNVGNVPGSTYTIDAQIHNNNFVFDDTHFEKRVSSQKYDAYGRILEQEKENGTSQALHWFGATDKPLAHVVNGQEAQSAYTSFERISFSEIATSGWDIQGGFQVQSESKSLSLASGIKQSEIFHLESHDGSDINLSISVPNAANIASCLLQSRRLIFTNLDNGLTWDPASNSTQIVLPPGDYEVELECGCQGVSCGLTNGVPDLTVALNYTNTATITNALGHGEPPKTGVEALKLYDASSSDRIQVISKSIPSGKYLLSFWYKGDPVKVRVNDGGTISESLSYGSGANPSTFQYFEKEVVLSSNGTIELVSESQGSISYIDELRLYPQGAQMTTYCFDRALRLHTQTDVNNRSTYYHYDAYGRLQYVQDQEGNFVQGYEYNYKN